MKAEYINTYGYILLVINIITISACIGNCMLWASMCIYEKHRPKYYNYIVSMVGVALVSILANSFALARMFDSFLIVRLTINKDIIQNTVIDRALMFVTFSGLLSSAFIFRKVTECEEV